MSVNSRVLVGRSRATVKYVGPVAGLEGTWLGLEWDDVSRGKHDGEVEGIKYFQCSKPGAGSFVRAEKVSTRGRSVLEALLSRYSNECGELGLPDVRDEELYVPTVRHHRVHIQVVGADKITSQQSQTQRLTSARLVGAGISHVGDPEALARAAINLHELDLTGNLVHSWDFVAELVSALPGLKVASLEPSLPCLQELHLAGNGIRSLQPPCAQQIESGIRNISDSSEQTMKSDVRTQQSPCAQQPCKPQGSNNTAPAQQQQQQQQQDLPGCTQQPCQPQGSGNAAPAQQQQQQQQQQNLPEPDDSGGCRGVSGFQCLKVLSLQDNQLADWHEVSRLSSLPALHTLNISNNPIPSIRCPNPESEQGAASYFPSLTTLYAAACSLSDWTDVDELNKLPALQELRLTGNPLLGQSKTGGRFEIIGRVGRLRMLNGSSVNTRERTDAEIRYMQKALSEMEALQDSNKAATMARLHPRLPQLAQRHGAVLSTATRTSSNSSIASSMIEVTLTCVATTPGAKMGSTKKKLPLSTTLAALRTLCEKLCKVKAISQKISLRSPDAPFPEEISTDDETLTLGQLGMQNGVELFIDENVSEEPPSS
ncbi:hypothetical protein DUNSADRAFT_6874 [Dunaliella salina]|uniref:Leucine-rich repeat-containing protein 51 n=1 Tax=Dunaliella salina TaxID=3046 RepID=A0ABQ7GME5_DUNSA|nr:hypothetical protein DUNSADRAFT_6874 [Dunaliella salina]|eukprot:KAF5835785.1 hypothetical protein DUNSADRAFT_6874 [Dunaliella salina]